MIQQLTSNDILSCSNLMSDTWNMDEYKGYERNEGYWIAGLIQVVSKAAYDPCYLAIKVVGYDGRINAFMTATTYYENYSGKAVMDVRDMIVDYHSKTNAEDVKTCMDYLIAHCKKNNVKDWRADSIHSEKHAKAYANFLNKNYDGHIRYGFRGEIK